MDTQIVNKAHSLPESKFSRITKSQFDSKSYKRINFKVYLGEKGFFSVQVNPFMKETIHPNYHLVLICPHQHTKSKQYLLQRVASRLSIANAWFSVVRDLDLRNHIFFRPEPWGLRNVRCDVLNLVAFLSTIMFRFLSILTGREDLPHSHPLIDLRTQLLIPGESQQY